MSAEGRFRFLTRYLFKPLRLALGSVPFTTLLLPENAVLNLEPDHDDDTAGGGRNVKTAQDYAKQFKANCYWMKYILASLVWISMLFYFIFIQ